MSEPVRYEWRIALPRWGGRAVYQSQDEAEARRLYAAARAAYRGTAPGQGPRLERRPVVAWERVEPPP